jgi:hypothetical protein
MLALHENALVAALANHRDIKPKVRTISSLPRLFGEKLLQQYVTDAPALYVVPGRIIMKDDDATLEFTVAGVVRNAAGHAQGRKGDGIDIGCDHLLTLAIRAINRQQLGQCSWSAVSAEMADDEVFEKSGISAIEIKFVSSAVALDADFGEEQFAELDDFLLLHADIDSPADAGELEYQSWLQEPPVYPTAHPDLTMDVQLPGASA